MNRVNQGSRAWCALAALALAATFAVPVRAQDDVAKAKPKESPYTLVPLLAPKAPVIDGRLSEEGWSNATGITRFQRAGAPRETPSRATEVYVTQDSENLFVAFRCGEPYPERRKRSAHGRDVSSIAEDDAVLVQLGPNRDAKTPYFEIVVNSSGAVALSQRGAKSKTWNAGGIQAAARDGLGGWVAEVRVPFKAVGRATPEAGEEWRANFARHIATVEPDEWATWAPLTSPSVQQPDRFAELRFE